MHSTNSAVSSPPNRTVLLTYIANLELEVDRLRRQGQFVEQETTAGLKKIHALCHNNSDDGRTLLEEIAKITKDSAGVLRDLHESPTYHPAHDQVMVVALRPLLESVFRRQQRLSGANNVELQLQLESECVEWFPSRLHHIFDNLISNSLKYQDAGKSEAWVRFAMRSTRDTYEFCLSDNGLGLPTNNGADVLELFYRAAPARAAGLGVGLAVVRMLVEQSGGTLTVDSGGNQGTTFVAVLPRYDLDDYLL